MATLDVLSDQGHRFDAPPMQAHGVWRRAQNLLSGWPGGAALLAVVAVTSALVAAGSLDSISIVGGAPLWAPVAVATVGLAASVTGRPLRWWATWGFAIAVVATITVATLHWWIRHSGLVLDRYPRTFVVLAWITTFCVGVALTGWWTGAISVRIVRLLNAPLSLLATFMLINSYYGYWPTVAALLNKPVAGQVSKESLTAQLRSQRVRTQLQGLDGQYGPVDIPGGAAGFAAAQAYVWLPPDYFKINHAGLSVVVMLPGKPGNVQDWTRAGGVTVTADGWARSHGGQAPVMIFIDENGASDRDTECVNSHLGNAESYITQVVPRYITNTLRITPSPSRWAIVGFSEGGTCALTLALRHPNIYGRFVDIAGDPAPSYWGGPTQTLRVLYNGSLAEQTAHTPILLMKNHRYAGLNGWFAAGNRDTLRIETQILARQALRAGIDVRSLSSGGGHSWTYARETFNRVYPTLVQVIS